MDLTQKRIIRSIPFWDGTCSKDGRYGLYAPATGGMEMLDLRTGRVCKTLIPKVRPCLIFLFLFFIIFKF